MDYKVPTGVYLHIDLKMDEFPVMPVYLHSRNAEMGINDLFWITNVETLVLRRDMAYYDIVLKREFELDIHNCNEDPHYDVYNCVFKWGQLVYQNESIYKNLEICQGINQSMNLSEKRIQT